MKSLAFGEFFSRPLEHQLSRLVDLWQLSQPPHLRHLTIIRDTALTKRIAHYTHYSFDNFTMLVDSGKASWEAVEVVTDNKKKDKTSTAAVDQDSDMIEYGFSKVQASRFQGRHNDATLLECVLASGAEAVYNTPFDHIARQLAEGTFGKGIAIPLEMMIATSDFDQGTRRTIGQGASATPRPKGSPRPKKEPAKPKPATPKSATSIPSTTEPAASNPTVPKPALPEPVMAKPTAAEPAVSELTVSKPTVVKVTASYPRRLPKARGRPRKYPAEGTPVDVESLTPHELKKLEKSQERAAHYVRRKKIAEEVAKRVEAGEDPVAANEAVLAELGSPKKEEKASALETHSTAPNPKPSTQRPARKRKRKASVQTTEPLEGNELLVNSTDKTAEPPTTLSEATTHIDDGKTAIAADSPDLLPSAISRQLDAAGEAVTLKDHGTQPTGISPHPPKKRKKSLKAGENTTRMNATPRTEIEDLKTAVYQALAQDVVRIDRGIGLGPHSTRRTGRGRPRKARLVIIKSTRLIELHLSQKEPEPSVEAATVTISIPSTSHVLEPFLTPTVTEKPLYTPQTVQQPHDQPSVRKVNHVSPYGLMFNEATPTPVPEYVSPYAPKPGEKRKRTPSSALETGFSGPDVAFLRYHPWLVL